MKIDKLKNWLLLGTVSVVIGACTTTSEDLSVMKAPKAEKIRKVLTKHGDKRVDNYYWMRDRKNKKVISYLKKENAYTDMHYKPMKRIESNLFKEFKSRIKKADESTPYKKGNFYYSLKHEEKSEYPIYLRRKNLKDKATVILDGNKLAKGKDFYNLRSLGVSPNGKILAYAEDLVGRNFFTIRFKNLETGKLLKLKVENVTTSFTWSNDSETFYYVKQDPKTLRYQWVFRGNTKTGDLKQIFFEPDEKFYVWLQKASTDNFIFINSYSSESAEVQILDANDPNKKARIFAPRKKMHEYSVDDAGEYFIVHSNLKAVNFKVFKTPDHDKTQEKKWKTLIGHRDSVLVESIEAFERFFALEIRKNGFTQIEFMDRATGKRWLLPLKEKIHVVSSSSNYEYKTNKFRYFYTSLTDPGSMFDYDFKTKKSKLLKSQEVLGGFKKENYESKQILATAKDGTKIPVSLVYRKGIKKDESNPVLLYGYGSYGFSMEPWFDRNVISLLDRGFIYAIAHIRGGSEMGRNWYLNGKRFNKKNTFTDFIAAAETLIKKKYTSKKKISAMGRSAGGLLMGAVINMRPDIFLGAVAGVPFVDVVTTMLDESIPLTTSEYEEWGNPNQPKYYKYIKSYSPYDNISKKDYPHLLVTSGLHDSQVQYWEPTKWVAKLREYKTDDNLLLLYTDMEAGHGGKTGRFKALEDDARDYAFILHIHGLKK